MALERIAVRPDGYLPSEKSEEKSQIGHRAETANLNGTQTPDTDGFRLFLDDGRVDIDSNLVENAIRSPAMNRRNALFAGHDDGGRNWARFASLIATCKMNSLRWGRRLRCGCQRCPVPR